MKAKRHSKIIEIIQDHPVDTQEELLRLLSESGFAVTQATVSRDIKELRLIKTATSGGGYRYTIPSKDALPDLSSQFHTFFAGSVISVDQCRNFVVVKCYTGMANAVCQMLDSLGLEGIVGTLSGDDTFFIMMREDEDAANLSQDLSKHMQGR